MTTRTISERDSEDFDSLWEFVSTELKHKIPRRYDMKKTLDIVQPFLRESEMILLAFGGAVCKDSQAEVYVSIAKLVPHVHEFSSCHSICSDILKAYTVLESLYSSRYNKDMCSYHFLLALILYIVEENNISLRKLLDLDLPEMRLISHGLNLNTSIINSYLSNRSQPSAEGRVATNAITRGSNLWINPRDAVSVSFFQCMDVLHRQYQDEIALLVFEALFLSMQRRIFTEQVYDRSSNAFADAIDRPLAFPLYGHEPRTTSVVVKVEPGSSHNTCNRYCVDVEENSWKWGDGFVHERNHLFLDRFRSLSRKFQQLGKPRNPFLLMVILRASLVEELPRIHETSASNFVASIKDIYRSSRNIFYIRSALSIIDSLIAIAFPLKCTIVLKLLEDVDFQKFPSLLPYLFIYSNCPIQSETGSDYLLELKRSTPSMRPLLITARCAAKNQGRLKVHILTKNTLSSIINRQSILEPSMLLHVVRNIHREPTEIRQTCKRLCCPQVAQLLNYLYSQNDVSLRDLFEFSSLDDNRTTKFSWMSGCFARISKNPFSIAEIVFHLHAILATESSSSFLSFYELLCKNYGRSTLKLLRWENIQRSINMERSGTNLSFFCDPLLHFAIPIAIALRDKSESSNFLAEALATLPVSYHFEILAVQLLMSHAQGLFPTSVLTSQRIVRTLLISKCNISLNLLGFVREYCSELLNSLRINPDNIPVSILEIAFRYLSMAAAGTWYVAEEPESELPEVFRFGPECPICREDLRNQGSGGFFVIDRCGHYFHVHCIFDHFRVSRRPVFENTKCPNCRFCIDQSARVPYHNMFFNGRESSLEAFVKNGPECIPSTLRKEAILKTLYPYEEMKAGFKEASIPLMDLSIRAYSSSTYDIFLFIY